MTLAIVTKELKSLTRSGVVLGLALALIILLGAAVTLSVQRIETFESERLAAEAADRRIWDSQGERNPHSAAHFSRYAFRPIPSLAAFEPGTLDYAGIAVWMEAHVQNPAVFRRAEELGDAGRMANLTPAFVLQIAAPLFLFLILFGAIAGEREDGTFRQVSASGVSAGRLLRGKLLGAGLGLGLVLVPALLLMVLVPLWSAGENGLPDPGMRAAGLVISHLIYLAAIGAIAIGVSALAGSRRAALLSLLGIWVVSFVLLPRMGAGTAVLLHQEPDAGELTRELRLASNAYYQDKDYIEAEKQRILSEYGVEKVEDLPINYGAFTLQSSEEHAHAGFEAFYARLDAIHERQDQVLRAVSLVSPVLALGEISAGLAGTDRLHHKAFVREAEVHRRKIIKQLNDDLMFNAGEAGYGYQADEKLWRSIEDFSYRQPRFLSLAPAYGVSAAILFAYLVGAFAFAWWAVARASRRVAQS